MKHVVFLVAVSAVTSVAAQTSSDDVPATENWWDKVGAEFFGQATMQEPRPEHEIRAQWTALSEDDQAAVLARCAQANGQNARAAKSQQEGSTDEGQDSRQADLVDDEAGPAADDGPSGKVALSTTTTGSVSGVEAQTTADDTSPAPDTGLAGTSGNGDAKMIRICDLIPHL